MSWGCGWYLCEQGVNDHPPLAPGRYALTSRAEGFAEEVVPFDLTAGETRLLEVSLRRPWRSAPRGCDAHARRH